MMQHSAQGWTCAPASFRLKAFRSGRLIITAAAAVGAAAVLMAAPAGAGAATGWSPAGTLHGCCGTLTALPGDVVVSISGTTTFDGVTPGVSIYRGATNAWTRGTDIPSPREHHASALLPDGRILVTGGEDTGFIYADEFPNTASTALYDPPTDTWSRPAPLREPRTHHTATTLPDGRVLTVGGYGRKTDPSTSTNPTLGSVEIYDPSSGAWSSGAALPTARANHSAVLLPSGKVLIVGGFTERDLLTSAQIYDPITDSWSSAGTMSLARRAPSATILRDGRVLVTGGGAGGLGRPAAIVDVYDPATNRWTTAASMMSPRYGSSAALLADGRVLAHGGIDDADEQVHHDNEIYDPTSNTWTVAGANTPQRGFGQLATLSSGRALLVGARDNALTYFAEIYDPSADTTSSGADTTPPAITVTRPRADEQFKVGDDITSAFSCTDAGGSGVASCAGAAKVDTQTAGTKVFAVTANDKAGNASTRRVSYRVVNSGPIVEPPKADELKALAATLVPDDLVATTDGFLVSDARANRVLEVSADGVARPVAGSGAPDDFAGDGEAAPTARLAGPSGIAEAPGGLLLVADGRNRRLRSVDRDGRIRTPTGAHGKAIGPVSRVAAVGNGAVAFVSDGRLGLVQRGRARLIDGPSGTITAVASLGGEALLVATTDTVYAGAPGGQFTAVAGGAPGPSGNGDGGPPSAARLNGITDVAFGPGAVVYIAETDRVRRFGPDHVIQTVAGGGTALRNTGAPTPATALRLRAVRSVAAAANGDVFIADRRAGTVWRVRPDGSAIRAAGCGRPATAACDPVDAQRTPVRGATEYAAPVTGTVRIRRPGARSFTLLTRAQLIPDRSELDTTAGTLDVTVAESADLFRTVRTRDDRYRLDQSPTARGQTALALAPAAACGTRANRQLRAKKKKGKRKKPPGLLSHTAKGRFTTSGKYASAAVRGTTWRTLQGCSGTTVSVSEGVVAVRDLRLKLTICVRKGQRYTALARPTAADRRRAAQRAKTRCSV